MTTGRHRADPPSDLDRRRDPLTGHESVVVSSRQDRPNLPVLGCPFCPGGLEAPEDYDVRWFVNRWPAMPDERCEIVLYTPRHDLAFWQLGTEGALRVVALWAERTRVLGAREDVEYVLIFENRGADVGATIAHPHGQIYAYDEIPPEPLRELTDGILTVPGAEDPHVVCHQGEWTAWVPEAAVWPYELRIATDGGQGALSDDDLDRVGLARVLVDALARLDQFMGAPVPYMLWVHQRPTGSEVHRSQPVHLHVSPLWRAPGTQRYVAAAELGGALFFNPVDPTRAAADLRTQPGV